MTLTKIAKTSVYAIKSIASNSVDIGTQFNVATLYEAVLRIRCGRGTGTAFTTAPIIVVEYSTVAFGAETTDDWGTLAQYQMAVGASIGSQAVSGTSNAADTTLLLAASTNFASNDKLFIHNTTIANSEFKKYNTLSSATFTFGTGDGLARAQTGSTVRNQAEFYDPVFDLGPIQQIRIIVNAYGSGQAVIVQADLGELTGL